MTVLVACFDFRRFGCIHNLKQTYDSFLKTVALPGGKGKTSVTDRSILRA